MANFVTEDDKRIRDLQELSELLLSDFLPVDRPGFLAAMRISVQQIIDLFAGSAPIQNLSGGSVNPDDAAGSNGDIYIKGTLNGNSISFYQKLNDIWVNIISFNFQVYETIPFDWDDTPLTSIPWTDERRSSFGEYPTIEIWMNDPTDPDYTETLVLPGYGVSKTKAAGSVTAINFDVDFSFSDIKTGYYLIKK